MKKDPETTIPVHSGELQMWLEQAEQRERLADAIQQQLMTGQYSDDIRADAYQRMLRYRSRAQAIRNNIKLGLDRTAR